MTILSEDETSLYNLEGDCGEDRMRQPTKHRDMLQIIVMTAGAR